jgi:hypothetical protein
MDTDVHCPNIRDGQEIWKDSAEFHGSPRCKSANIGSSREEEGKKAKAIRLLTFGTTSELEEASGVLSLTIPSILVHEVMSIDL